MCGVLAKMKFEDLTPESQEAARSTLSEMLKMKYQATYDLPDNTVAYLGHRVRESFMALESERKQTGSGED